MIRFSVLLTSVLLTAISAMGQLKLAEVFSDNMVLQQGEPVKVWGLGVPGREVKVQFSGNLRRAIVQPDSTWEISFPRQKSSENILSIQVSMVDERITLNNLLIGDVWLCIGQSNMEWPMFREKHWATEAVQTFQPQIRLLNPPPVGRGVYALQYNDSLLRRLAAGRFYDWNGWRSCDSTEVRNMSAVGYYFAKELVKAVHVPVGLINLSIGGAPLESFLDEQELVQDQAFHQKVQGRWLDNDALPKWIRERGRQNVGKVLDAPGDEMGPHHPYKPGYAFAEGVRPLKDLPIRGVLVYQGESNAEEMERVNEYGDLFAVLIEQYRAHWNQPRMPVYWVQLSSIERPFWPVFRDEQRRLLARTEHTGMTVCSDIGLRNDVHPPDKKTVGERLSRWALKGVYHRNIVPSGPLARSARYRYGRVEIRFRFADQGLGTQDGKPIRGFSVNGTDPVNAQIKGRKVIISLTEKPAFIHYGWQPYTDANLVNMEQLPASTFKLVVH